MCAGYEKYLINICSVNARQLLTTSRPTFVQSLSVSLPDYPKRCAALPGITGLAQVKSRYDTSVESVSRKLQYDLYYLKNGRLLLDLKIMAATVKVMARGDGAH